MKPDPILALTTQLVLLSLIAIGGVNSVLPELHRMVVEQNGWVSNSEFSNYFAIAQASPGPNMLIVALIGWKVGGLPGALAATAAICGPSCFLTFWIVRIWDRFKTAPWRAAVQRGLAPLTVGLVLSTGYLVSQAAGLDVAALAITAAVAVLATVTRLHPLLWLSGGGVLGLLGLV
jgi:chromate transporter